MASPAPSPANPTSQLRPWKEGCAAFLAYLLVALWWLWPLPEVWQTQSVDVGNPWDLTNADFDLVTWILAWSTHALTHAPFDLFDAPIFYPAPNALAFSEHAIGYLPLFAPVYLWTDNPFLATNLTLLATFPLCGTATFAWMRRFTTGLAAFAAGFVFAFCYLRYATLWHFHLLGTFWMPLVLLSSERFFDRARPGDAAILGAVLSLQLLASYYLAYAVTILYLLYLPLAAWHWRAKLDRTRLLGWLLSCLVAASLFALASLPYFALRSEGLLPDYSEGAWRFDKGWPAGTAPGNLGWITLTIALLGALWPLRASSHARWVGITLFAGGILFSLGPEPEIAGWYFATPYNILTELVPGFETVRLPRRFLVIMQLGLATLAGLGVARLLGLSRPAWRTPLALGLLLLLASDTLRLPALITHEKPDLQNLPTAYQHLASNADEGPLLELPLTKGTAETRRMLYGTTHWIPMYGGYSGYPPPRSQRFHRLVGALPGRRPLKNLAQLTDLNWILVHLDELPAEQRARWSGRLPPELAEIVRTPEHVLVRFQPRPPDDEK